MFEDLSWRVRQWLRRKRSPKDVFEGIYASGKWGGQPGEFCSGHGTHDAALADPYVETVTGRAADLGFAEHVGVDLGCGDFAIGGRLESLFSAFIGVDVVAPLVDHLEKRYGSDRIRFLCLDITADELPPGDVCFVRQVLQHLDNARILAFLPKLRAYRHVFITEHLPSSMDQPNLDIVMGSGTRLRRRSGIDLTAPPFGLPPARIRILLDVAVSGGILRTVHYEP